jgi:hypothetical protein
MTAHLLVVRIVGTARVGTSESRVGNPCIAVEVPRPSPTSALAGADVAAERARHADLGITLTYEPDRNLVRVQATPGWALERACRRGEWAVEDTHPVRVTVVNQRREQTLAVSPRCRQPRRVRLQRP